MNLPAPRSTEPELKMGDIEKMCANLSDLRELASKLESTARSVELRILGPQPNDEGAEAIATNVPCLVGVVGATTRDIRTHLFEVAHSLDRITKELGAIGGEGGAPR